ncbi:2-dehydro-3-deoxygalactonokinase [Caenimonas sedimenti]|uniref:2-dehydro-3-deoxygalactonokinase n=1 Tax=Caenimonas sedimenti TaxID=2596921 RepID=A0A562ZY40_9BURK|nr:2-dehydro-3-deoxygalactonokinase [Caenimonas sedimenti]TWO73074.1 2-dehydro-3-deoxygalactonokinase [Caenimonas sedimenti]
MKALVAVDWGTSSLRVARIGEDGTVLEERGNPRGILTVPAGGFPQVLDETCGDWLRQAPGELCLVSGMAGSRQGWVEAPYCACPAGFGEIGAHLQWIDARTAIVPGLSCEHDGVPDVLRGEEVQVFGAMSLLDQTEGLFVLPGTHSKWVRVEGGRVQSFSTWMSGEFYALLRQHSILARTLPAEDGPLDEDAFRQGLAQAAGSGSLLRAAFSARTLSLFDRMPAAGMPSYLSGLVIGEELRAQPRAASPVTVIGSATLAQRYASALTWQGTASRCLGAEATWRGLWRIARGVQA